VSEVSALTVLFTYVSLRSKTSLADNIEPLENALPAFLNVDISTKVQDDNSFKAGVYRMQVEGWKFYAGTKDRDPASGKTKKAAILFQFTVLEGPVDEANGYRRVANRKYSEYVTIGNEIDPTGEGLPKEKPIRDRMGIRPLLDFLEAAGVVLGDTVNLTSALPSVRSRVVRVELAQRLGTEKDGTPCIRNNVTRNGWHPDTGSEAPALRAYLDRNIKLEPAAAAAAAVPAPQSAFATSFSDS
jgi:hypothetical protein